MFVRVSGLGGIKDRIVNGHHLGKIPARISWSRQMTIENIEAIEICWYITHNKNYKDSPRELKKWLLRKYKLRPKWNKR